MHITRYTLALFFLAASPGCPGAGALRYPNAGACAALRDWLRDWLQAGLEGESEGESETETSEIHAGELEIVTHEGEFEAETNETHEVEFK
jgi:hypothetical protein